MAINTTNAYAINIGAVGVAGTFFGMPLDALILGAVAGAVMLSFRDGVSRGKGIAAIVTSSIIAGSFSPAIIGYLVVHHSFTDNGSMHNILQPMIPVVLGGSWTWLLPRIAQIGDRVFAAIGERIAKIFGGANK